MSDKCREEFEAWSKAEYECVLDEGLVEGQIAWSAWQAAYNCPRSGGDIGNWIKAEPSDNYEMLLRQFGSLKSLLNSQAHILSHYRKKDYTLSEPRLKELEAELESEKAMNAQLTEELAAIPTSEGKPQ